MKALVVVFNIAMSLAFMPLQAYAAVTASQQARATASSNFMAEFYQPDGAHIVYSTNVPFTNVDPTQSFILPDGRAVNDGKSDVGIYCKSNLNLTWYLKIGVTGGNLPDNKLKYYLSQPTVWDGSASITTNGAITPDPPDWTVIPKGMSTTIYQSGSNDTVNTPFGTLATINFQLDPEGIPGGTYMAIVTYTVTTSP